MKVLFLINLKKKKGKEIQLKETFDDKQFYKNYFLLAFNINVQLFNAAVFIKPKESNINVDKVHVSCYEIQHQLSTKIKVKTIQKQ